MSELIVRQNDSNSSPFDTIRGYREDGSEYWTGRELTKWLGYKEWRNGEKAIKRAMVSCKNQGQDPKLHLVEVNKHSRSNGLGVQEINDYELSRFGCYLVAQNADPEKEMVAMAQGYFASKTREAELKPVAPDQKQLPAVTIHQYMEEARAWGLDTDPLIKSLITQRLAEELGSKALPAANIPVQVILTVRAHELGYPQSRIGSGVQLGSFVSKMLSPIGKTQHGRYPVNVYELTPELDEVIHAYFR